MATLTGVTLESLKKMLTRPTEDQKGVMKRPARITGHISVERLQSNNHRNKNHHVSCFIALLLYWAVFSHAGGSNLLT